MRPRTLALAAVLAAGLVSRVDSHELRPGYLEIRENVGSGLTVLWKPPIRGGRLLPLRPIFPESCRIEGGGDDRVPVPRKLQCEGALAGTAISIAGLEGYSTSVLVRAHHANGASETHLLEATTPSVTLGGSTSGSGRALAFLRLGVEHIVLGLDHLLFVLGLLLLVKERLMLVKTITSFTAAHSITLAIATLGYASAPAAPTNAAIALSIFFLGPEIVRSWRGETSFTLRHPWLVAFVFGLLHGFGFASGLTEMGLPPKEVPLALLVFNLGVELGQLLFVAAILVLERYFALKVRWPRWAGLLPGYAVGSLGAFWVIQQTAILLGWSP